MWLQLPRHTLSVSAAPWIFSTTRTTRRKSSAPPATLPCILTSTIILRHVRPPRRTSLLHRHTATRPTTRVLPPKHGVLPPLSPRILRRNQTGNALHWHVVGPREAAWVPGQWRWILKMLSCGRRRPEHDAGLRCCSIRALASPSHYPISLPPFEHFFSLFSQFSSLADVIESLRWRGTICSPCQWAAVYLRFFLTSFSNLHC